MNSAQLRESFLDYFRNNGHEIVPSSPLVPGHDPTLLFTNAGMVQFKEVFLGLDPRPYKRAASSQRCLRAGGKHNDLEQVGYTARHHTFFEMLGNFSFGDYFKREAIRYAWEYLTVVLKLPPQKLWITVYEQDDDAADIWLKEMKIDPARFSRCGEKDNFWSMGDTGPCGPCSEIFYDHGAHIAGGPPGSPDADADRYVEIWNLVFMQYNRGADGVLHSLPHPSVDTGMGLERLAAVMQGVHSNYEIDLFQQLLKAAARETNTSGLTNNSLKVIADHIRACSFLIVDGVIPGNEGRGYVLRRIIRRAIRHGYKLGCRAPFFHKLVADLSKEMGQAYPGLAAAQTRVTEVLRAEEERFFETIEHGMEILDAELAGLRRAGKATLDGEIAFKLHDTYGFPLDLTQDVCREHGVGVDEAGFDAAMARQREQARAAGKFKMATGLEYDGVKTQFQGYDRLHAQGKVVALYKDGVAVKELGAPDTGVVVLDHTPFYAESGGQVGDTGTLWLTGASAPAFAVEDTQKIQPDVSGHHGRVRNGSIKVGDVVDARVDEAERARTVRNHSVTHLMHKALRDVLGSHVQQKGSLVDSAKTRFDFSHNAPLTGEQIRAVETRVNRAILANVAVSARLMAYDDAIKSGAMALFGEKYGDTVRVLGMGEFSTELCGGTHVRATGDIGLFKIISEGGVASGVRRIEAVAGESALAWVEQTEQHLMQVAELLKAGRDTVEDKVRQLLDKTRKLEKEMAQLKGKLASGQGADLAAQAEQINGIKVLAARLDGADAKALRDTVDQLKNKLGSAAVVLAAVSEGKVSLVAGVTADYQARIKAGELVNMVAQQVGGKGGGRADMAQAGGTNPEALDGALRSVSNWVREQLA